MTGTERVAAHIKSAMVHSPNWDALPDQMREVLTILSENVASVLHEDPHNRDKWREIAQLAFMVEIKHCNLSK